MTASRPLLLPEQEDINGIRFPVWLDDTGRRVAADCPHRRVRIRLSSGRGRWSRGCRRGKT